MKKRVFALLAAIAFVPAVAGAQQVPVRVGGNVPAPTRTKYVVPEYPEAARSARVSGVVIAEAVIDADGRVADTRILRSIAGLDEAAMAALRQWAYTPTTLNGVPVPVIMTVTVNFSLAGASRASGASGTAGAFGVTGVTGVASAPRMWNDKELLRIGGDVKAPERTRYVSPVYPDAAKDAGVQGVVIIELVIDENGHVAEAKILRSILELDQAAIDAVLQWEYTPTMLNGQAVPVLMTVTVNFTLSR